MTQPLFPTTIASQVVDLQNRLHNLQTHGILDVADQSGVAMATQTGLNIEGLHVATMTASSVSISIPAHTTNYPIAATQTNTFQVVSPATNPTLATGFWAFANAQWLTGFTFFEPLIVDSNTVTLETLATGFFAEAQFQYFTLYAQQDTGAVEITLNGATWWLGTFTALWAGTNGTGSPEAITGLSTSLDILNAGMLS
jgi:hypothetical protein